MGKRRKRNKNNRSYKLVIKHRYTRTRRGIEGIENMCTVDAKQENKKTNENGV